MNMTQTFSTALSCTIADLTLSDQNDVPLAQWQVGKPVKLSTTLIFSDQANGVLANLLMAANLNIRITFHAQPTKPDREIELGSVTLTTIADVLTYTATLTLDAMPTYFAADKSYQIGAVVRVGNDPFSVPSLIRGFVEGPMLPGNSSEADSAAAGGSKAQVKYAELAIAAAPKTSRRKEGQLEKSSKQQEKS